MEAVLWYLLSGTRGGMNRVRILQAIDEHPRNANQLAEDLDLDYKTVTHHLEVLIDHDVVRSSGDDYAAVYLPTERVKSNWRTIDEITEKVN